MSFNADDFLAKVKLVGSIPDGRFEDSEILSLANDQVLSIVVPIIIAQKEEFYVRSEDQAITANQAEYPIPYRAIGLGLREIKIIRDRAIVDVTRISPTEIVTTDTGVPTSFYPQAQDIILYPTPNQTRDTLRLSYFLTPSNIVEMSKVAQITAIDRITGTITASTPADWTTNDTYDLVSSKNGHQTKAFDLVSSSVVASTSITFTPSDIPASIVVGDYVCQSGESPYLQVPDVCYRFVVQLTANELMRELGTMQGDLQLGEAEAQKLAQTMTALMVSRVVGAPKKLKIYL